MKRRFYAAVVLAALSGSCPAQAQTLSFSGYTWQTRSARNQGPGPNDWDAANAFVDKRGWLHLKITQTPGKWRCAEVYMQTPLGFGRYEFEVRGRIDQFDPNIVLGLFNYPSPDVGPDGTNEIDIEFARWGNPKWDNGNYTVYPSSGKRVGTESGATFPFSLTGDISTHSFTWTSRAVFFESDENGKRGVTRPIRRWQYAPGEARLIPQKPLPVHLNLWLFQGKAPTNGRSVEIVIRRFTFTPEKATRAAP